MIPSNFVSYFVNLSSFWSPKYLKRSAWLEHAPFAFWLTGAAVPRSIVELGTHRGYSYFSFCQAVSELGLNTKCFAIDTWEGDEHAGFYDNDIYKMVEAYNRENYRDFSRLIRSTFINALPKIKDKSVDILHIDGRHFYDDVLQDFESYKSKLSERAVVLFHDTQVKDRGFGVYRLWSELEQMYPCFEFLHGHGLGVLGYGSNLPPALRDLFEIQKTEEIDDVRRAYARLGAGVRDGYRVQDLASRVQKLSTRVKELDSELKALRADRSAQKARIAQAKQALEKTTREFEAIRNSSSWRFTEPIRKVLSTSRRFLVASPEASATVPDKKDSLGRAKSQILRVYRTAVPRAARERVPQGLKSFLRGGTVEATTSAANQRIQQAVAADLAIQRKDWRSAIKILDAVVAEDGSTSHASNYVKQSLANRMLGRLDEARNVVERAPKAYSKRVDILAAKAEIATAKESWAEAVSRWNLVIQADKEWVTARAYACLGQALRELGDLDQSSIFLSSALEEFRDSTELLAELARTEMAKEDWLSAIEFWNRVLESSSGPTALYARARFDRSIAQRIAYLTDYQDQIGHNTERRRLRLLNGDRPKVALCTAISSNYDTLKLPHKIEVDLDYIVFSDAPLKVHSPFVIRPMTYLDGDSTRTARFVKTHPHTLLSDYDIAIWVDSNVCVLEELNPLIEAFIASKKPIAAIKHPQRETLYEEAAECIRIGKDDKGAIEEQMSRYSAEGFESDGLVESNVMFVNIRDERAIRFLDDWWAEIDKGSKRDQLSINYALKKNDVEYHHLVEPPKTARDHPSFCVVRHDYGQSSANDLLDALGAKVENPYVGSPYCDVRQERLTAMQHRTIDIVVCVHNALTDVQACFASLAAAKSMRAHRLIIVDDGSDEETEEFLKSFVNATTWASLHRNETSLGYTKAANQGLAISTADLVVVLNSDTIVTDFWADKLADAVFSTPGAGIVGPLSNAASYQSIPSHQRSGTQTAINVLPPNVTPEDMNRLCETWTTNGILPRVPLVHGFCFGITRDTINRIGTFDEDRFPRGYGEENDYCFRAVDAGIGLVVASHTYVYHAKSKSFRDEERVKLMKAGSCAFRERHGTSRVKRATQSMDKNPLLCAFREKAADLYPQSKPVHIRDSNLGTALQSGDYDFLDLGSSKGGSLKLANGKLGGTRGIGIDRDAKKVHAAQTQGFEVIQADALDLHGHPNSVRFAVMNHFLEHLPGISDARQCIGAASAVASEFIFIKQPWFDSDGDLFRLGLKLYWSDWTGHPNHMTVLELHECFAQLPDIERWVICGRGHVFDSLDSAVHPLASPVDQHAWDARIHPDKPAIDFQFPVFRETLCLVQKAHADVDVQSLLRGFSQVTLLYDSGA